MVNTGTSMSSPHVAGTVALMLQANPTLDVSHVIDMLRTTARHDDFTGQGWSPTFGPGKIDADKAGTYTFEADVSMGSLSISRSIAFRVVP